MITPSKLVNEILSLARVDGEFLLLAKRLQMLHELNRDVFHKAVKKAKLGSRKAYYLLEMAKQLRGISLPQRRLEAIGWTKAHIIAKHINASNALSLLERAEKKSAHTISLFGSRVVSHQGGAAASCCTSTRNNTRRSRK